MTNQKVNDLDELKGIYGLLVKAIKSLYPSLNLNRPDLSAAHGYFTNPSATFSLEALRNLPSLLTFKYSPWNHLRHEQRPALRDAINTYRPYGFRPSQLLPPFEKHAQLIDGRHAFTFSGSHFSLGGAAACNYLLAQDVVHHNFTIVAKLDAAGHLAAITLIDRSNAVELQANTGIVLLNGEKSPLPLNKGDINAWRDYHTVSLLTTYGARLTCSVDLRVCSVAVNGFYHGKLRGIFGAANAEPSHDLKQLDGKVAADSGALGKAYALGTNCPAGKPHDAAVHTASAPQCVKYFADYDSNLSPAFFFIRPQQYREACEHAVAEAATPADKATAACDVARGYVVAARSENLWASLPDDCVHCEDSRPLGEDFKTTAPQKKADVVVVVDTATANLAELVHPVLTQLRADLKARDIADSHIVVIGYNKERIFTRLYTQAATGSTEHSADLKIVDGGPAYEKPIRTGHASVDARLEHRAAVQEQLRRDLLVSSDAKAFRTAMDYPFRANAAKAIVAIRSDSLAPATGLIKQLGVIVQHALAERAGISLHLVGPVADLKAPADFKGTPVAFNEKTILSLDAIKKRQVSGSTAQQRNALEYSTDLGIETTLKAGGYVFNANAFQDAKTPAERKKFVGVVAGALAEHLARTETSAECECELVDGLYAQTDCEVTDTKWRTPTVSGNDPTFEI